MGRSVLVIVAHPDDEVLGCGGTIARHVEQGDQVHVAILADGVLSRERDDASDAELAWRRAAGRDAARLLGASEPRFLDLPDQRLDSLPLLEVVRRIEEIARELGPEIVYTHHSGDLNSDHRIVARAVLTAFRPLPGSRTREIYGCEVPSSTEWGFGSATTFAPARFVEILPRLKMAALRAYDLEMRASPHPRSYDAVEALARWRGATVGLPAAEAFTVYRQLALCDARGPLDQ